MWQVAAYGVDRPFVDNQEGHSLAATGKLEHTPLPWPRASVVGALPCTHMNLSNVCNSPGWMAVVLHGTFLASPASFK